MRYTVLLPCLNESLTLNTCIEKALLFLKINNLDGEVLVADNGSIDRSQEIAKKAGARVITIPEKGYGNALIGGIREATGDYIIMGDADDSYDFSNLLPFVEKLDGGYDLVMGNRFIGGIQPKAMPFLHRYLGNPVLSFLGKVFFNIKINDFHCGLRAFSKNAVQNLDLRCGGMEFASEMVVKASLAKLKITEVPTKLFKDGRNRPPHLKTWSDGWRHLKFLLIFAPKWLFLYPGLIATIIGFLLSCVILISPLEIFKVILDVHTLLYAIFLTLIGMQCVYLYLFTKIFYFRNGVNIQFERVWKTFNDNFSLENGLKLGSLILISGFSLAVFSILNWKEVGFGELSPQVNLRLVVPACFLMFSGIQILFNSFFYNILKGD